MDGSGVVRRLADRPGLLVLAALSGGFVTTFAVLLRRPPDGYTHPALAAAAPLAEAYFVHLVVLVAAVAVAREAYARWSDGERPPPLRYEVRLRRVQAALAVVFVVALAWVLFRQATMSGDVRSPPFLAYAVSLASAAGLLLSVPASFLILVAAPRAE